MLNQCNFIGRLGQDPEIRYSANQKAIASISIGCTEKWKDQQGQPQERTEWVRCSAFGKLAEIMGEYLRKGSLVYVSGKMQTRKWQDQQGQDRYTTEIVVSEMKMLSSNQNNSQQSSQQQQQAGWGSQQQQQRAPQQQQQQRQQYNQQHAQQQSQPQYNEPPMDFDDDIPFGYIGIAHSNNLLHCL
jgi:single-strand DNA-binding protein